MQGSKIISIAGTQSIDIFHTETQEKGKNYANLRWLGINLISAKCLY